MTNIMAIKHVQVFSTRCLLKKESLILEIIQRLQNKFPVYKQVSATTQMKPITMYYQYIIIYNIIMIRMYFKEMDVTLVNCFTNLQFIGFYWLLSASRGTFHSMELGDTFLIPRNHWFIEPVYFSKELPRKKYKCSAQILIIQTISPLLVTDI